jgi:hypothetical protein
MSNRPSKAYCYCPERFININNNIIKEFAKEVTKEICQNDDGVKMPKPFGRIFIAGALYEGRTLNRAATQKHNMIIYHTNDATDGYVFRAIVRFSPKAFKFAFYYGLNSYKIIRNSITNCIKKGNWAHWGQYKSFKEIK